MHSELGRGLALVAFVAGQHLKDEAPLELPDCIRIGHSGAVHLRY
jgi:hypothetical protein